VTGWKAGLFWIASLTVVVGLAGGALGQSQTIAVELSAGDVSSPSSLPGTYTVPVEVTVKASGDACLCESTEVEMQIGELGRPTR